MQQKFRQAIEENYDLRIDTCMEAVRGSIAETFVLNGRYFCKLVKKPLIVSYLLQSLPLVDVLACAGIEHISRTVKPREGYFVRVDDTLIILSEYLDAVSTREYDLKTFGALLSRIHNVPVILDAPRENFSTGFTDILTVVLDRAGAVHDVALEPFYHVMEKYSDTMRRQLEVYRKLAVMQRQRTLPPFSVTHGDVQGNVMIAPTGALYIIDWDEAVIAPRERDLWLFADKPEFMTGYGTGVSFDQQLLDYYTCNAFFVNCVFQVEDLLQEDTDTEKWQASLEKFSWRISPQGWMQDKLAAVVTRYT